MRRRGLVVSGAVALALTGVTVLGWPHRAAAASCATTTGEVRVAVVVDYGSALPASGLSRRCVTVSPRASGVEALRGAVGSVGTDSSGKVCQIGPVPASYDHANCSAPQNGTVSYWAYFHGDGSGWTYSSVGAGGSRVRSAVVEGWHFVSMPASQRVSAPPPRNFPDGPSYLWQSTCRVVAPPPSPPHTPGVGAGAPTPGGGAGSVAGTTPTGPTGTRQGTTPSTSSTMSSTTRRAASSTSGPARSSTTAPAVTGLRSSRTAPLLSEAEIEAAADATGPSSRPVGAIVAGAGGVGLVALGLVVATRRSRRRRLLDDQAD
jgi:hypothetical protein